MPTDLDAWLAQHQEEALEPDLEICDPHHHLWEREENRYTWKELRRDLAGGHRVTSTVFVECMANYREKGPEEERPLGETEFVVEQAQESSQRGGPRIAAISGFVDLTLGEGARPVLEEHIRLGNGLFRGVRHAAAWDEHPDVKNSHTHPTRDLYQQPEFRRGVELLGEMDLVCEAWQYHTQLAGDEGLEGLVRSTPGTTFVLNHCGGPVGVGPYAEGLRSSEFDRWRRGIDALARRENVVVKLGGILMPRNGHDLHLRDQPPDSEEVAHTIAPWIRHCLDQFGPERSMFESNFPVDRMSCSYTVLYNAFKRLVEGESVSFREQVFRETALRVYGIGG